MEVKIGIEELREKKIMVCTPMYGGMCSGLYSKACADLSTLATKSVSYTHLTLPTICSV